MEESLIHKPFIGLETLQAIALCKNLSVCIVQDRKYYEVASGGGDGSGAGFIIEKIKGKYNLSSMTVGILGMAFKGESDDPRSSLAYKLKRILKFNCVEVLTSDPYVKDDKSLIDEELVLAKSDLLIIAAPHNRYRDLVTEKPVVDIWNLRGAGTSI